MDITLALPDAFVRAYPPETAPDGDAIWVAFQGDDVLVRASGRSIELPRGDRRVAIGDVATEPELFVGSFGDLACIAVRVRDDARLPEELEPIDLRGLHGRLPPDLYAVVGYAYQIVRWQSASRFCAFCGSTTGPVVGEWGKRCVACNHVAYPHVSPCVIVLIHDGGDRLLLAHRRGRGVMRSLVAGFLEPSESLEAALRREVREEVGLEVEDIRYFASQPWPFPHQLMVGFFARHAGGEIRVDGHELDEAAWYDVDELPTLPGPISIARRLIDAFVAERRALRATGRGE